MKRSEFLLIYTRSAVLPFAGNSLGINNELFLPFFRWRRLPFNSADNMFCFLHVFGLY